MQQKVYSFEGTEATVTWDRARCIHFEACVHGLPRVFDKDRRPWIAPDEATPEALTAVVLRCPTGALHLRVRGEDPEAPPAANTVTPAPDGPLYLRGQVTVQAPDGTVLLQDTRVALCRCGRSGNKPLCDNTHLGDADHAPFAHDGRLPDATGDALDTGGPLTVTPQVDGPLLVEGPLTLTGADGATTTRAKVALCRCGASANKPYCDGSHKRVGFRSAP